MFIRLVKDRWVVSEGLECLEGKVEATLQVASNKGSTVSKTFKCRS